MTDTVLFDVLQMPYSLAMKDTGSRIQYWQWGRQAADEIERLRAALRGIIEADCEAIKMNDGVICLKPGPYAVIARTALGEGKE